MRQASRPAGAADDSSPRPIGYYVHHHGDGHRRRASAIAAHLHSPVTGLSSLPAPPGWPGDWVQLARDDEPRPEIGTEVDARGRLHWVPTEHDGLRSRTAAVSAWIERTRPSLVVVDVSVEMTLLVRLHGVPVVIAAMLGDRTDLPHTLGRAAATGLFAPWPGPSADADAIGTGLAPVHHVGAFSRFDHLTPTLRTSSPPSSPPSSSTRSSTSTDVLRLWGTGGSDVGPDELAAAAAATPDRRWRTPGPDVWADLCAAGVVVVHGGHNAVAEVAAARRPAVVVAQSRPFGEQVRRVERLRELGIVALDAWPEPRHWPDLLRTAEAVGGDVWREWSPGDGARRAAQWLESVAARP